MWVTNVLAVLQVVERLIPLVERMTSAPKDGANKALAVTDQALQTTAQLLGPAAAEDPTVHALLQAKIAADVALANALQRYAPPTPSLGPAA